MISVGSLGYVAGDNCFKDVNLHDEFGYVKVYINQTKLS